MEHNTPLIRQDSWGRILFGTVSKPGQTLEIPCTIPRKRNGIPPPHEEQTDAFVNHFRLFLCLVLGFQKCFPVTKANENKFRFNTFSVQAILNQ
jgi:hypothetical protein